MVVILFPCYNGIIDSEVIMSHPVNDQILDTIRELRELVADLEAITLELQGEGDLAAAEDSYNELIEARKELTRLEGYFS